ncbi:MAG: M20/M25/M40 family metallo-hydrolase, partial [Gemmatimonadota bacterium]|nr:M20/M25/M40 family metallo-hydrolase [Gemmatimonadota bacterium]
RDEAERITAAALASDGAWRKLTHLCDRIGHRIVGSPALDRAIDWALEAMALDGLENVRRQRVTVGHWERGEERAVLLQPRRMELAMLGLGRSVGTPPGGVTAEVVVVPDFDTFHALPDDAVEGRIVLWNAPFTTYSATVAYRWSGAEEAAKRGAVASLVRTVGRRSLQNPHTGVQAPWEDGARAIPAAALSVEDAAMLARLAESGERVVVRLEMGARHFSDVESANVLAEITGRELPEEIVVIGGHLDSWDVGQGAHDDGGGCVISMEAVRILHELGLRPRRTVRVVLWTEEESGGAGGRAYRKNPGTAAERHVAAIESDGGVEAPSGFGVTVWKPGGRDVDTERQDRALRVLKELAPLFAESGARDMAPGGGGADISPLMEDGVPGLALQTPMDLYWDIHHSSADTVDKVDPDALRRNTAAMAVMAYVLAEMPGELGD